MDNPNLPSEQNERAERKFAAPDSLNFITDGTIDRILQRRSHREAILRNCAKHDLDLALNYAEAALDHIRDMRRAKYKVTEELKETRVTLEAFLVAVMAMQREENGVEHE